MRSVNISYCFLIIQTARRLMGCTDIYLFRHILYTNYKMKITIFAGQMHMLRPTLYVVTNQEYKIPPSAS